MIEYAVENFNKKGNEGIKQYGKGSRSGTYDDTLSEAVKVLLPVPYITMLGHRCDNE
jgi:hypothetical protein